MRETLEGIRENFRLALGVPEPEARRLARRLFFEYGRSVIDVWRLRSEAFVPKITSFDADAHRARRGPEERPRLSSRDRARRKLGDGRRDAARPRADAGRRRPAGARPGRRGHAPEPEDAPRRRVDRHRLVHGHRVPGARGGRGGAGGGAARRPRLSGGPGGRLLLRPPHAFSPLAGPPRPLLQVRDPPRLLPAQPRRLVLQRLGRSDRRRRVALSRGGCAPHHEPRGRRSGSRRARAPDAVVQLLPVLEGRERFGRSGGVRPESGGRVHAP